MQFTGTNGLLKLVPGSNIQGLLDLGDASNQLIISKGLNTALAYTGGTFVPQAGQAYVVTASTIYTFDQAGFVAQDVIADDLDAHRQGRRLRPPRRCPPRRRGP